MGRLGEFTQVRVADLQPVDVLFEVTNRCAGTMLVAMPEQPLDPFQLGQQASTRCLVVVGDTPAYCSSTVRRIVVWNNVWTTPRVQELRREFRQASRLRSCVRPLSMRHIGRWPRWGSRSGPKQSSDFESHWFQRVLRIVGRPPIVISISSFTLAPTRGSGGRRFGAAAFPRIVVAFASQAIRWAQSPTETARGFDRRKWRYRDTIVGQVMAPLHDAS